MHRSRLLVATLIVVAVPAFLRISGQAYTTYAKWATTSVDFYINPRNADVSEGAAEAALISGADSWSEQSASPFKFVYAGRVGDTTTSYDGRNVVFFRASTSGSTIASTYSWWSGDRMLDSDIIFWDSGFTFFAGSGCGGSNAAYIEDIAAHEFGHALGLNHSTTTDATMYPSYSTCSQAQRSLSPDDIAGLEFLYPPEATSNTAPAVAIVNPANGSPAAEGIAVLFSGSATDSEDGNLSAGLVWTSSRDGQIGTGSSFSRVLTVGTHTISAAVSDSNGLMSSRHVSVVVNSTTPINSAPAVSIGTPANNTSVTEGTSLTFSGSATDAEDGTLTSKIMWSSSLAGPLGMGGKFQKSLSPGEHTITASVSDSAGSEAKASVKVTVKPMDAPLPAVVLQVRGYKVKGSRYADLTWTGAYWSAVDIYRDGTLITRAVNRGSYTDVLTTKGNGSSTYLICEAETTTVCSNQVVVRF